MNLIFQTHGLNFPGQSKIRLPLGSKFMRAVRQYGQPSLTFLINPEETLQRERVFECHTEYDQLMDAQHLSYVGTVELAPLEEGGTIYHIFERETPNADR